MTDAGQGLRLQKMTLMVLIMTPLALYLPAAVGAPADAGLLIVALLLALWRPQAVLRAMRSGAFVLLSGLAVLALLASRRVDPASTLYLAKFTAGALTGIAFHFVYVDQVRVASASGRSRPAAPLLAAYVATLSWVALMTGFGHTQLATLSLTLAALALFHLLRGPRRLLCASIMVPAFLLLNSKALLLALLTGYIVLGNLRARGERLVFLTARAAVLTVILVPIALASLWLFRPDRFEDLVSPRRSISTMARLDLARAGVAAFRDNPLLGLGGYGMNVAYHFHRYHDERNLAPLIAEGRTRSHGEVYGTGFTSGVHNLFLDYLTTYGGLSFALLMVLLARGLTMALRGGYALKIAAAVTICVLGLGWQYTASAFGTALLIFACWPFRFTAGARVTPRGLREPEFGAMQHGAL